MFAETLMKRMTETQVQIYRAADHLEDQGTGSWNDDIGGEPQGRDLGCSLLQ